MLQCYPGAKKSQPSVSNYQPGQGREWQTEHRQSIANVLESNDDLSAVEQRWLESIWVSEGLQVTSEIQQWWRKARLKIAAPLTLRAIDKYVKKDNPGNEKGYGKEDLVDQYIQEVPCSTLFFSRKR